MEASKGGLWLTSYWCYPNRVGNYSLPPAIKLVNRVVFVGDTFLLHEMPLTNWSAPWHIRFDWFACSVGISLDRR